MILVAGERMELAAFYVATSTAATGTVYEPDEFVDQNVEVNGAVHWLRNYGAGLRTVVEAFPNFPLDLQHLLINDCWLLGERSAARRDSASTPAQDLQRIRLAEGRRRCPRYPAC
jgi:predicted ester cyclase